MLAGPPQAEIMLSGGMAMPVDVVTGVGIELFLSPQGIGVLSLALYPAKAGLSHDEAIDFNYRIAQFRQRPYAQFHKWHGAGRGCSHCGPEPAARSWD